MPAAALGRVTSLGTTEADAWPRIGVTPAELVHREGTLRVLRYRAREGAPKRPPLLIALPVINRAYILDLTPGTSFVAACADAGIDTYAIDWGRPGLADRATGLDALAAELLPRIETRVLRASGAERLVLSGYCLGGTIATVRAALASAHAHERARLAGLVTFQAPVSFSDAGPLGDLVPEGRLPLDALLGAFGNMPGALLQQGFYAMKPQQLATKYRRVWEKLEDEEAVEEFAALEVWNSDNVPVTGAFYRRLIQDLYRDDRLCQGTLDVAGERVSLAAIQCPVLVASAVDDLICLPKQAAALLDEVSSAKKKLLPLKGGHVRSVIAPKARYEVARELASWLDGLA